MCLLPYAKMCPCPSAEVKQPCLLGLLDVWMLYYLHWSIGAGDIFSRKGRAFRGWLDNACAVLISGLRSLWPNVLWGGRAWSEVGPWGHYLEGCILAPGSSLPLLLHSWPLFLHMLSALPFCLWKLWTKINVPFFKLYMSGILSQWWESRWFFLNKGF